MIIVLLYFAILHLIRCSCPEGFDLVSEGQCRGYYGQLTLSDAQAASVAIDKCKELQAEPVIIHNDEEQAYWKKLYYKGSQSSGYLLLGLVCNTTPQEWQWADGSSLDYRPSEGSSTLDSACQTNCAVYMPSGGTPGQWFKYCGSASPFFIYCITQIHQPVPSTDSCAQFEVDSDDEVCYQIGTNAESWQDAQLTCKKLGANLASIHNANENSFVRRLAVSKGDVHGVYLGATVSGKGGNFGWIDGSEWDYSNFYPGFPRSGFGDCIALDTSATSGQWMNVDCSSQIPVACIREKITPIERNATCSLDTLMEGTIITSPGFPFDASMPCDYYLEADAGKRVELEIAFLEANSCCDSLILYEGYFGGFVLANLTGEIRNVTYTTDSNKMRVSWVPNGGVNVQGMAMTFRGV